MSRTRIVGGVYTKITGGDYKMYTEGDTIISAAGKNDFANAEKVIIGTNPKKMNFRGKGGTLLITKVESEPKGDVSPNQKVTYKVTQYNFSEKVTEADKNRIQWAIKIDDKQEVLKEKGEKLVLTIKEEWAGKEISVMPYLKEPVEKISVKTKIIREEVLIIIGTENKKKELIFPAMGIRKLRTKFAKYPFVRFIIFTGSYTEDQLSKIELSASYHNKRVECQRVNTIDDVINIINSGDISNKKDKSIRKVKSIFIYSHGYVYEKNNEHEGVIAFDYDNKINEQKLDKSSFSKIDNNIFLDNNRTELYSYACRTGIGVSSTTGITDPKKNNSLAQHMANIGKITVFAYMRKTDYKNTWGTIAHRRTYESDHDSGENIWENFKSDLYDMLPDPDDMKEFSKYRAHQEIIDGAVWNINGAYIDVKPGTTPDSVPDTFYKYTPKK